MEARVSESGLEFIFINIVSLREAGALGRAEMSSSFRVKVIPRLLTRFMYTGLIRSTYIINHAVLHSLLGVDRKDGLLRVFPCDLACVVSRPVNA